MLGPTCELTKCIINKKCIGLHRLIFIAMINNMIWFHILLSIDMHWAGVVFMLCRLHIPANMRRWPAASLLLGQRRRRLANSKPTLAQRVMFAGIGCTEGNGLVHSNAYSVYLPVINVSFRCRKNMKLIRSGHFVLGLQWMLKKSLAHLHIFENLTTSFWAHKNMKLTHGWHFDRIIKITRPHISMLLLIFD